MVHLSVNVNKIATVRNSRGGTVPSVLDAVDVCVAAGAHGITVHPRADARHITARDVREISACLRARTDSEATHVARRLPPSPGLRWTGQPARFAPVEYNIEGDPRPDLLELVHEVRPTQCTLVPVQEGEITSQAGWRGDARSTDAIERAVRELRAAGVRVSLFVDPDEAPIRWASAMHADRVELYTAPFAQAFEQGAGPARASFDRYARAAELAHELGLGVNAGHDLDLANLTLFRTLPHLAEVSIGHALVSHALFVGLDASVRAYLVALRA